MVTKSAGDATSDPGVAQTVQQVSTSLSAADGVATQAAQTLGLVHQARLAQAQRTAVTLAAEFGADDPRTVAAQADVASGQSTVARVTALQRQLTVPAVQVAADGWALQGFVLDENYAPMARYTVYFADSDHVFLRQYGFAYTDDNGYFLINYPGDTEQSPTSAVALYIGVVDADAKPVALGSVALQPALGAATLKTILVPADGQTLGDPGQAIRDAALPPAPTASAPR